MSSTNASVIFDALAYALREGYIPSCDYTSARNALEDVIDSYKDGLSKSLEEDMDTLVNGETR